MVDSSAYDIFISYRRSGGAEYARMLYLELKARGYRCFFDYNSLRSGKFNEDIYAAIEQCTYFILVLTEGALDRCQSEDDWVRHEIEHAIQNKKDIVPVAPSGAPRAIPDVLPASLECIRNIQVSKLDIDDLFEKSIDKIIEDRFDPAINPVRKRRRKRNALVAGVLAAIGLTAALVWTTKDKVEQKLSGAKSENVITNAAGEVMSQLIVHAKIDGNPAKGARICGYKGESDDLAEPVLLPKGKTCGPFFVTAQRGDDEYSTVIEQIEIDWAGKKEISLELEKDPAPGTCVALPLTNGVPMYMVWCPKGKFKINVYDVEGVKEELRESSVEHGFWIARYEYTHAQDDAVWARKCEEGVKGAAENANYPRDFGGFEHERKTWKKLEAYGLRMPHIGEWCRACQYGDWNPTTSNIIEYACIAATSLGQCNPTGLLKPNNLGLYDIYGNAAERVFGLAELCVGLPNPMPKFVSNFEASTIGGDFHSYPFQLAMFLFDIGSVGGNNFSSIRPVANRIKEWRNLIVKNGEDRKVYGVRSKNGYIRNEKWESESRDRYRKKMQKDKNADKPILTQWGKIMY